MSKSIAPLGIHIRTTLRCADFVVGQGFPPHPLVRPPPYHPPPAAASPLPSRFALAASRLALACSRSPARVPRHPVASGGASTTVTVPTQFPPSYFHAGMGEACQCRDHLVSVLGVPLRVGLSTTSPRPASKTRRASGLSVAIPHARNPVGGAVLRAGVVHGPSCRPRPRMRVRGRRARAAGWLSVARLRRSPLPSPESLAGTSTLGDRGPCTTPSLPAVPSSSRSVLAAQQCPPLPVSVAAACWSSPWPGSS